MKKILIKLNVLITILISILMYSQNGLAQCNNTSVLQTEWNFNSLNVQCNGTPSGGASTSPVFLNGQGNYCPNINAGCAIALLGSKGHTNTNFFSNAICLQNFYSVYYNYNPDALTFDPNSIYNIRVRYVLPEGTGGCMSNFDLRILQKQFDGTQPKVNFEKQGVAVFRNGVLIYNQSQNILASHINDNMSFNLGTSSEMCSDGSETVVFDIVFGLVHQLNKYHNVFGNEANYAVTQVGYDNIKVYGTCTGVTPNAFANLATCGATTPNNDAKITLINFGGTDKYDYNLGSTYTGSATFASGSTAIPINGVILTNLPNPATSQDYTIRVFSSSGCTHDLKVTLDPTTCPVDCTKPTGGTFTPTQGTCAVNNVVNSDASIAVTGIVGGDKIGISMSGSYTGELYTTANSLSSGAFTFTGLPNPTGSQLYTIRVFNGGDNCFRDEIVTLTEKSCGPCQTACVTIRSALSKDNTLSNNTNCYSACTGTQKINLNLTKTVAPSTGTTCPTNTPFVWTVTINNTGDMAATDIQVADLLPSGLVYVSNTASVGTYGQGSGWIIPTLAAASSATLTITTKALMAGTFTNIAEIITALPLNDPNSTPGNGITTEDDYATASITVTGPNSPSISKGFSPMLTQPNTPTTLTIKITNNEASPVTLTADFIDNLPSTPAQMVIAATPNLNSTMTGIVAVAGGTSIKIPSGTTLLPGLNQLSIDVTVPSNGNYCNDIAVGALKTSSCDNIQAAQACILANSNFVMAPVLKKTMLPAAIQTGQNATLTLTIENRNAAIMTIDQDFVDYFPSGLVMAGAPTSSCASLTVTAENSNKELKIASGGTIPANTICTITVPVTSSTAGKYCNVIVMNGLITSVGAINNVGNEDISEACITVTATPCTALSGLTIAATPTGTIAPSGTVSLAASATGTGASTLYTWAAGSGSFNPQSATTTYTASATAGTYQVTVTADNQLTGYGTCTATATLDITVAAACALTASATGTNVLCKGATTGTATATASGNVGAVTYLWSDGAASTTASIASLPAGTYTVTATESATCSAIANVTISEPATALAFTTSRVNVTCYNTANGQVTITASGGVSPYEYSINDGTNYQSSGVFMNLSPGTYTIKIKDVNGCTVTCN